MSAPRVAPEKHAANFLAFVKLAAIRLWLRVYEFGDLVRAAPARKDSFQRNKPRRNQIGNRSLWRYLPVRQISPKRQLSQPISAIGGNQLIDLLPL